MQRYRGVQRALVLVLAMTSCAYADDTTTTDNPVKVVAGQRLVVERPNGKGEIPVYISEDGHSVDMARPQPSVVRALVIVHGKLRNADVYNASGLKAIQSAGAAGKGTLLVTPQFLTKLDIDAFHLPDTMLRWTGGGWMEGNNATNAAVSSFDAFDVILEQLANRTLFPNLKTVVVAGHSAGGQIVQRYTIVGRGGDKLIHSGVHVRYVIANPSSYMYFSPERPVLDPKGEFTFAIRRKSCNGKYNDWKYGVNNPIPYVGNAKFDDMEARYLRRDVVYLLGTADTDPNHPALDKTCSGEDEGPYRFFRGKAYFTYMELRHPELKEEGASQKLWFVPGVEHDGDKMLNSTCGLAGLFDIGSCSTRVFDPKP